MILYLSLRILRAAVKVPKAIWYEIYDSYLFIRPYVSHLGTLLPQRQKKTINDGSNTVMSLSEDIGGRSWMAQILSRYIFRFRLAKRENGRRNVTVFRCVLASL